MPDLYSNVRRANSNYTPQYIGSNTDTIKSVADTLQLRSLQNQNAIDDKLVAAINEQYAPGDEAIGQKIYEDISGVRDQIASSDQGFENSTGLVRNLVRDKFLTNRDRIEGLRNQKLFKAFEDKRLNLGTKGEVFGPEWRGTKNPDGSYNKFETTVEERLDWDKRGESIFNQMEADLIASGYKADPNNPDYLKSIITGGIDDTKIAAVANAGLARFKESDEGKQYIKTLQRDNNGITQDQINEKVYNNLVNIGLERKHAIRQEKLEQLNQYALRAKYESTEPPPNPNFATTGTGLAISNNVQDKSVIDNEDEIHYDSDSKNYYKLELVPSGGRGGSVLTRVPVEAPSVINSKLRAEYERAKSTKGKNFDFSSFEDYKESKREAIKNAAQITGSPTQIEEDLKPILASKANSALPTAPLYLGNGKAINLNQLADAAGVSPFDIEVEPVQSYEESPNSNIPGGFTQMRIKYRQGAKPNNDAPLTLLMPISNEQVLAAAPIDRLYKNSLYKGGEDVYTQQNPYDIEKEFGVPLRNAKGEKLVYITDTQFLNKNKQRKGQLPYSTEVQEMVIDPMTGELRLSLDSSGQPINMTIGEWKQGMKSYMSKIYRGSVNSGINAYGEKDIKQRDIIE